MAARVARAADGTARRWLRRLALLLLALLAAPTLLILLYRWVDPPLTPLMLARWSQGFGIAQSWRPLDEISRELRFAVIASEDNRFCAHRGFDWHELGGQLQAWRDGARPRGASTISMQTVKNLVLWESRSNLRKLLEAWLTPQLELLWPKRRILEVYLNIVELGPGIYGAEAAARHWFGKGADRLTRAEAARLAAILPAPLRRDAAKPSATTQRHAQTIARRIDQLGPLLDCAR
jgi:monofunctional biosynthetic peptidoglycan transglycosylase